VGAAGLRGSSTVGAQPNFYVGSAVADVAARGCCSVTHSTAGSADRGRSGRSCRSHRSCPRVRDAPNGIHCELTDRQSAASRPALEVGRPQEL